MYKLKGKTILIGKEPGQGRLLVALKENGKSIAIGAPGCVPGCVSRCRPADGIAHAKIAVDDNGNMIVSNMNSRNVTFVNGAEIIAKRILSSNTLELGNDRYRISIPMVIDLAKKLVVAAPAATTANGQRSYNITHLRYVWENLLASRRKIQERQKRINLIRTGCGVFTGCTLPCIFLFGSYGYAVTGIGVLGNIYSFIGLKKDNTIDVMERINEEFQDKYVCPNCNKFLGNLSYKLLKRQYSMHCPYCKCEFVEK